MVSKKITKFKTPAEIAARKAFIAGADAAIQGDKWNFNDLRKLSTNDLLDRLEKVDGQATLMRWRIWWAIRQQFKSDKLFGQYIISLKENSQYAPLIGTQQDINRALNAGRFCEKYTITDLSAWGLLKSSVYALSRPANADVADKVFNEVKRRNLANTEVERLIYEAKAITVLKEPEQVERINYDKVNSGELRVIDVKRNIAQIPEVLETTGEEFETTLSYVEQAPVTVLGQRLQEAFAVAALESAHDSADIALTIIEKKSEAPVFCPSLVDRRFTAWTTAPVVRDRTGDISDRRPVELKDVSYDDLLLELASRDASMLSDDQKVSEMVLLDERFKMSHIKLIGLHSSASREYQAKVYFKK